MKVKFFKTEEFKCPCCGEVIVCPQLLEMLEEAREHAGFPFRITSGYRCEKHNKEVKGVEDSAHTKGLAVDIAVSDSRQRYWLLIALLSAGFRRIGIAENYIHVDIDNSKPRFVVWTYYKKSKNK